MLSNNIKVFDIIEYLDHAILEVIGDITREIVKVESISESILENSVTFCDYTDDNKAIYNITHSKSKVIVCKHGHIIDNLDKTFLIVDNPKEIIIKIINRFFAPTKHVGIHHTAIIHQKAKIGKNAYIGPHVYVGHCVIGDNIVLHANVVVGDNTAIGDNVTISYNTSIGSDGFGYIRNKNKKLIKFPHIGGIIIEDDVEIGSNTCIDKGALGTTFIGEGTKIDNLVHIAHNVKIGKRSLIIAHSIIGGSTTIGDDSWIAPNASVRDNINIGSNSIVGLGSVVTKDVLDNMIVVGNPARPIEKFKKLNK